jgi:plastocyanin domain-containing protein
MNETEGAVTLFSVILIGLIAFWIIRDAVAAGIRRGRSDDDLPLNRRR